MDPLKPSESNDRNGGTTLRKSLTILLACLVSLSAAASAPRAANEVVWHSFTVTAPDARLCPGKEKVFTLAVHGYRAKSEDVVIGTNGEIELLPGGSAERWPVGGVEIKISPPRVGEIVKKPGGGGLFGDFMTNPDGIAHVTYKAKESGKESLEFTFTGFDFRTKKILTQKQTRTFRVWPCIFTIFLNLFARASLPEGNDIVVLGTGGGEARLDDEGRLTGDGELSWNEIMHLPPECTDAEQSGQSAFTITGGQGEDSIQLEFAFDTLSLPAASSLCTVQGFSVNTPVLPDNSGDPGIELGFHDLTIAIGGGSASFPYPVAEYSGGTTVAVIPTQDENAAAGLDPLFAAASLSLWSGR